MLFRRDIHDSHEPVPRVSLCATHVVMDDEDDDDHDHDDDALLQQEAPTRYSTEAVNDEKRIAQAAFDVEKKRIAQARCVANFGASVDESSRMQAMTMMMKAAPETIRETDCEAPSQNVFLGDGCSILFMRRVTQRHDMIMIMVRCDMKRSTDDENGEDDDGG